MDTHKKLEDYYNSQFYQNQSSISFSSAKVILSVLYKLYQPLSVVDIGCGVGGWLAAAESLGSQKLKGFDGSWVTKDSLLSKNIDFTTMDIAKNELEFTEKYDLCISVEVAEHLPESCSNRFVQTLCKASDVILFSAAIKYQGGTNHVNEQWQSYWIKLFDANGYKCFDILRPVLWGNKEVASWYRQNIFIFASCASDFVNINNLKTTTAPIADIVHPEMYENKCVMLESLYKQVKYPTYRFFLGCIKRYFINKWNLLVKKIIRYVGYGDQVPRGLV